MNTINATLCYLEKNGQILMLHRIKKQDDIHEGKWNGLGGKFEEGESPEDCVIREVLEESGLTIINPKLSGIITFPKFNGESSWLVFLYKANEFFGDIIDSDEGQLEWVDKDKIFNLNLWEGDRYFLKWMFEDRFFSAKFEYTNKKLIDYKVNFYTI